MNRITKAFADTATRMFFRTGEVTAVTEHGASFRTIDVSGDALQDVSWSVGDKVQVRPDLDGFTTRTYTPVCWDTTRGSTTLLAHMPGTGPGSTWVRTVTTGSPCQIFGPRRSLKLDDLAGPILFVGDETSFALAAAWRGRHPDRPPVAELFEVTDPDDCNPALEAVGLSAAQLFHRRDGSPHLDLLSATLIDLLRGHGDTTLCLTGKAQTIATLRRELKHAGLADRPIKVKAYWDENRSGLD